MYKLKRSIDPLASYACSCKQKKLSAGSTVITAIVLSQIIHALLDPFPKPPLRSGVLICCASVDRVDCIVNTEVVFATRFGDGTWKKCFTAFTWRVVRVHVTMKPFTLVKVRGTVVTTIASDVNIFMLLASYGPQVHYINLK